MEGRSKSDQEELSVEQLQDLKDALRNPLTDQSVLIPLGSKAFIPGRIVSEVVSVRVNDNVKKEMSRDEARGFLQREIDQKKNHLKSQNNTAPIPNNEKQIIVEEEDRMKQTTKQQHSKNNKTSSSSSPSKLSYFEIREEINDAGEEIRSEAIDVTKQLEYLKKSTGEEKLDEHLGATVGPQGGDSGDDHLIITETEDMPKPLSDTEYDALTRRLDELAMLEENAEMQKDLNIKSSKKLQSNGWSKGFFNKKKGTNQRKDALSKNKATTISTTTTTNKMASNNNEPVKTAKTQTKPTTLLEPDNKAVTFSGSNQVQEIPRIGEKSISNVPKPSTTRPIESTVFSGIIQEKTIIPATKKKPAENNTNTAAVPTTRPVDQPKKKLSRFAQERQQGLR